MAGAADRDQASAGGDVEPPARPQSLQETLEKKASRRPMSVPSASSNSSLGSGRSGRSQSGQGGEVFPDVHRDVVILSSEPSVDDEIGAVKAAGGDGSD